MKRNTTKSWLKKAALFLLINVCWVNIYAQTEISDAAGLVAIKNDLNGSYKLTADIDLSANDWDPIGSYDTSRGGDGPFTGTLDGNGHIITGLKYNDASVDNDYPAGNNVIGLFSAIGTGGVVKNLGIENANIVAGQKAGAIVGILRDNGVIENCYVANSYIQTGGHTGAIAGQVRGSAVLRNCWSNALVYSSGGNAGGLVGMIRDDNSKISKCYYSGIVRSVSSCPAGIVAARDGGAPTVEYCVNLAPYILGPSNLRVVGNSSVLRVANYSLATTLLNSNVDNYGGASTVPVTDGNYGAAARHGANIPGGDANALNVAFYTDGNGINDFSGLGWDFTDTWTMPTNGGYPILKWEAARTGNTELTVLKIKEIGCVYENRSLNLSDMVITGRVNVLDFTCADDNVTITDGVAFFEDTDLTEQKTVTINFAAKTGFNLTATETSFDLTICPVEFPPYPDGTISEVYNSGPGMAIDKDAITDEDSKMIVISNTSLASFNSYIAGLLADDYTQLTTNTIEGNVFYLLKSEDQLYYIYYTAVSNEVRIIKDNSTRTLLANLDASVQGTGNTEFYSYSLDYTHGEGQTSKSDYWMIDCGALIIIKLKDNSMFIVDSGHERQSSIAAMEGLLNFMYEITGQEVGTTLNVRGWFFTHAHGDHVYLVYPFLTRYHDLINVESVLFNFPSYQTMRSGYDSGTFLMKETFNTYYPDCKYAKLHTGENFTLQGVKFDVLYTHEDAVSSAGRTTIGDFNSTSTVLKVTMDGKSFMLMGDATEQAASIMLKIYTSNTLQSDCVQPGHHGYNNLTNLYNAIAAPLAFFSNSEENAGPGSNNLAKYQGLINAAENVKVVYSDPYTIKITVKDGEFVTENIPSYRSYFTKVELPDLNKGTTVGGAKVELDMVLEQSSLLEQVIDKSITGTDSKVTAEACSRILDGLTSTKYCTEIIPATIAWTMKKPVLLKWYVIYTANDNANNVGRNPKNWILCGSNDAETWEEIDYVENGGLPNQNFVGTAFAIVDPKPYQYYAFKTFTTAGAAILQYSEIGLYGDENATVGISTPSTDSDLPVTINREGNNQISVNYNGEMDQYTQLSIYNVAGQKEINQSLTSQKTLIALSAGVHIVKISNSKGNTTRKIILN